MSILSYWLFCLPERPGTASPSLVIIIVSSSAREAGALASIAAKTPCPVITCNTIGQLKTKLRTTSPALVVSRMRLADSYSDDALALLAQAGLLPGTKVIVLAGADCTPKQEARQLSLGADCVLRDPLRPDVLCEYVSKFLRQPAGRPVRGLELRDFTLAGATVFPEKQQMQRGPRSVHLSPKEVALARLLAESGGKLLTYDLIYAELFQRAFAGDSANMRVLLGKLAGSYRELGLDLRAAIRVTPKTGCTYVGLAAGPAERKNPKKKPRPKSRL